MKNGGTKVYRNVFDVLIKTWRNEGIRGVQRGLGPAVSHSSTGLGSAAKMACSTFTRSRSMVHVWVSVFLFITTTACANTVCARPLRTF